LPVRGSRANDFLRSTRGENRVELPLEELSSSLEKSLGVLGGVKLLDAGVKGGDECVHIPDVASSVVELQGEEGIGEEEGGVVGVEGESGCRQVPAVALLDAMGKNSGTTT
jgi:hypothetical protein